MDSRWFKGLKSQEDKDKRKRDVRAAAHILEMLEEILASEIKESAPDYDIPSWSHKQADQNGFNRAIRSVLSLIKTKEG